MAKSRRPFRRRRNFRVETDERVLYSERCSYAPRNRALSFVGGEVSVTTQRVVFEPNLLAALLRRRPWELRYNEIVETRTDHIDAGWPWGPLPALRIITNNSGARIPNQDILVLRNEELADQLEYWINNGWRWSHPDSPFQ